jgi:hypothetical protein
MHIILDYSKPDVIQVVEFYVISNAGTKTVIPDQNGAVVRVTLPEGYSNLQFQDGQLGDRFIETDGGFGDTVPVIPGSGQYQLVFAFELPYSTSFDFTEPMPLDVSSGTFLVSEGVKANAPGMQDGGLKDMGNSSATRYQLYTIGAYKTGDLLKVNVSGAPNQTVNNVPIVGSDSTRNLIVGVGGLGLTLIVAAAWLFWRDRKRAHQLEPVSLKKKASSDEILDAIIALDDQYNAGNIAPAAYQQRRADLKEEYQKLENRD